MNCRASRTRSHVRRRQPGQEAVDRRIHPGPIALEKSTPHHPGDQIRFIYHRYVLEKKRFISGSFFLKDSRPS